MSTLVEFVPPKKAYLRYIIDNMREADKIEVMASHGATPGQAIRNSVKMSNRVAVVLFDGKPAAVFGLVIKDLLTGTGIPWLLGTDLIDEHRLAFVKNTRPGIQEMLSICPRLENYVHTENSKSVRWLATMGFKFEDPEPIGRKGELFSKFWMEA